MSSAADRTANGPANGPADWAVEGRDWPDCEASRFVEAGGLRWHVQMARMSGTSKSPSFSGSVARMSST